MAGTASFVPFAVIHLARQVARFVEVAPSVELDAARLAMVAPPGTTDSFVDPLTAVRRAGELLPFLQSDDQLVRVRAGARLIGVADVLGRIPGGEAFGAALESRTPASSLALPLLALATGIETWVGTQPRLLAAYTWQLHEDVHRELANRAIATEALRDLDVPAEARDAAREGALRVAVAAADELLQAGVPVLAASGLDALATLLPHTGYAEARRAAARLATAMQIHDPDAKRALVDAIDNVRSGDPARPLRNLTAVLKRQFGPRSLTAAVHLGEDVLARLVGPSPDLGVRLPLESARASKTGPRGTELTKIVSSAARIFDLPHPLTYAEVLPTVELLLAHDYRGAGADPTLPWVRRLFGALEPAVFHASIHAAIEAVRQVEQGTADRPAPVRAFLKGARVALTQERRRATVNPLLAAIPRTVTGRPGELGRNYRL